MSLENTNSPGTNSSLTLGFSPCPNDTFIFDAMLNGRIDTEGISFKPVIEDVEKLNQRAFSTSLDITKLSYHAYAYLTDRYLLLDAGSALGNNCGPLLISKRPYSKEDLPGLRVAIPGKYTTANFLLSLYEPRCGEKVEMLFSDIEDAITQDRVDAGVIIHENRFTYGQKGLLKIVDLGEYWEGRTKLPIPLGGIVIRRDLPEDVVARVNRVLRRSIEYAFENPSASKGFVKRYAQEMSEEVMYKHIDLYVNKYSIDLGTEGRQAVQALFASAGSLGLIPEITEKIFIEQP